MSSAENYLHFFCSCVLHLLCYRPVLTTQHQRPAGMLMAEQKNLYGSAVGASSTVNNGTYPPVGTVQPTARGRPVVSVSNHMKSDDTIDTKPENTDALKPSVTNSKTVDISSHVRAQSEVDKPLAVVSAKLIDKDEQNTVPSFKERKSFVNRNALPSFPPCDVVASKLPTSKGPGNVGKERRSSTEVNSPSTSSASKSTAGSSKRLVVLSSVPVHNIFIVKSSLFEGWMGLF